MEQRPLTAQQIKAKHDVREAYCDFWNNIKFKKGWDVPSFQRNEVEHLLDEAAEIVVRIRSYLDEKNPGFKLRMRDGSAREYLWDLEHKQRNPNSDPEHFVREMVHATFCDANGYVEGLKKEELDRLIDEVLDYKRSQSSDLKAFSLVKDSWNTMKELMEEVLEHEAFLLTPEEAVKFLSKDQLRMLRGLGRGLSKVNDDICEFLEKKPKVQEPSTPTPIVTLGEPKEVQVEEVESNSGSSMEEESAPFVEEMDDKEEPKDKQEESKDPQGVQIEEVTEDNSKDEDMAENEQQFMVEEPKEEKKDPSIIKIQHVAEDVDILKEKIKSLQEVSNELQYETLAQDPGAKERVSKLQKNCLEYTEGLMKDLLKLDEIVTSQETRPLRKAQVTTIQSMIEEVESVSKKLRGLAQQLHQEEEEKKRKQAEEEQEKKRKLEEEEQERKKKELEEKPKVEAQVAPSKEPEPEKEEEEEEDKTEKQTKSQKKKQTKSQPHQGINWSSLRFRPKFEVSETRDSYVIASYIPGMSDEDIGIKLSKDKSAITIEGLREPSYQELHQMRNLVRNRLRSDPFYSFGVDEQEEDSLLMKAGAGRFGKFSETYELPPHVDTESIGATYDRGVLKVEIPKLRRKPQPQTQRGPYGFPGGGRRQGGFFGDNDFWW